MKKKSQYLNGLLNIIVIFILPVIPVSTLRAQHENQKDHQSKTVIALRIEEKIKIDGILNENAWKNEGITDFVQRDPIEGNPPTQKTEVWIGYDDDALYVAAKLYDTSPDSIVTRLSRRDESVRSDKFAIKIDPWLDHRTGFYFLTTAAGALEDGILYNNGSEDLSWDGVWENGVTIDEDGWNVEMKIPYSQLRFPKKSIHTWGINLLRFIDRSNEFMFYVLIPKNSSGDASWFAHLTGIEEIEQPRRIEILPYISTSENYIQAESGNPFNDGSELFNQFGVDMKAGISASLTLDLTLNPDFGNVEVDPEVVNLTASETFFDERRPFFIEGSNIFAFGQGGVNKNRKFNYDDPLSFHSRRIGRVPQGEPISNSDFISIPTGTTILAAAKVSGKLTREWTLGATNALTGREYADLDLSGNRFREEVEPLTNYTVVRALREFNEGRHGLGVLGTSTIRSLNESNQNLESVHTKNAYMGGVDGWITLDSDRKYVINGWIGASRIQGHKSVISKIQRSSLHYFQRPDADHLNLDSSATSMSGIGGRVYINKQKGNIIFNSGFASISSGYEVNDLGFHTNADQINWHVETGWQNFEPGNILRNKTFTVATFKNWDHGGTLYDGGYMLNLDILFLNYWGAELSYSYLPASLDKSATRGGPLMIRPIFRFADLIVNTDRRRKLSLEANLSSGIATRWFWNYKLSLTWKPNTQFNLTVEPSYFWDVSEAFYVGEQEDPLALNTFGKRYLYAETDNRGFSATMRMNWTFTPKLSLQFYFQPLIFAIRYRDYKELAEPGTFNLNIYGKDGESTITQSEDGSTFTIDPDGSGSAQPFDIDNADFNFKSFRGNVILRWEYLPGSVFFLTWTQDRKDLTEFNGLFDLGDDISRINRADSDNVIIAKFSYWWNP